MEKQSSDSKDGLSKVRPARDAEHGVQQSEREEGRSSHYNSSTSVALAPIGVFDSGAGGLSILSVLQQTLPGENFIYLGDTGNCPYGNRSEAEIRELTVRANQFLVDRGCKLIVVACNTASQTALSTLRATFSLPFVGVVPAVKPATRITRSGRIGVIATNQAARASYLKQLIDDFASGVSVSAVGCPELVLLVEQGKFDGPEVEETLQNALQPLLDQGIDVLVLGCTHFPLLRPVIERVAGPKVKVIDSGAAIARRTHSILESEGLINPQRNEPRNGTLEIWCSGDEQAFSQIASRALGEELQARHVDL